MVSILLSVFNGETTLTKTLQSIEKQTWPHWSLIAINDGSTDDTRKILEGFQKQYPDQVIVRSHKQCKGLTLSLIEAAKMATTPYLARIDAGDQFLPTKLEKQISFLEQHPEIGVVGCNYTDIFLPSRRQKESDLPLTDQAIRKRLYRQNPFAHSCVVLRREEYFQSGGYNPAARYGQDFELWFRLLKITKAANLRDKLCIRTNSEHSISRQKQREQMMQGLRTWSRNMNPLNPCHYPIAIELLTILLIPQWLRKRLRRLLNQ